MVNFLRKSLRRLKSRFARGTLILVYHRIHEPVLDPWSLSVSPAHFAEHVAVLRRSFYPTSLQQVARALRGDTKLNPKSVVMTFDDGYADNLYAALPLLEHFDIPATMFLISGAIGSLEEFWWDELTSLLLTPYALPDQLEVSIHGRVYSWQLGQAAEYREADSGNYSSWRVAEPPPTFRHDLYMELWQLIHSLSIQDQKKVMHTLKNRAGSSSRLATHRILNQEECLALARGAGIEVGAHTVNHLSLASLPIDAQRKEILGSKLRLEEILGQPVKSFSYPFGKRQDYTAETMALARESGFSIACSNVSGVVDTTTDPFQLPRVHIQDCDGDTFENRLLSKLYA